ncbi:MAG: M24 family metallopeptidase, partial [Blastocatellia bacterium]
EIWNGRMLGQEEARTQSGVEEVRDARELAAFLTQLLPEAGSALPSRGAKITPDKATLALWQEDFATVRETFAKGEGALHLLLPPGADQREYRQEAELAQQLKRAMASLRIVPAHPIFAELRLIKSPIEQALLQHAVDITSEAFHRVFAMVGQARYEYEVQAEFEYTFRRRNADFWGYPCIVGAGANATTLHYITSQDRLDDESLLLMDCAAEFDHYTADITRTIPVDGRFSKEQAEIYQIVYDAQQASIARVRPGNLVGSVMDSASEKRSVQGVTAEIIKDGLLRLGLITSKENNEFRIWYMHGSSHWIGMNVHDVGSYQTPLAPGMVLTVEPGIYIRPDALDQLPQTPENRQFIAAVRPAFEKYKGIGVRIEDDILVTEGVPRVMSSRIPSRLDEVEAVIARLSGELRRSGWPQAAPRKRP